MHEERIQTALGKHKLASQQMIPLISIISVTNRVY
jgi:hypothetical protein